ncbi:MAG: hypothetical protein IKM46_08675 [Clostridia bacterium]|nr:hypothetical protein [Clostridia bacterium]
MNISAIKEYAYNLLITSIKNDKFDEYVFCIPPFSVFVKDEYGNEEECVFAKMEAIYTYHRNNPDFKIDEKFYNNLRSAISKVKGSYSFLSLLRMVEYQIVSENEHRSPFSLDIITLLEDIKNNLYKNQDLYKSEIYERKKFWKTVEQHNESLNSNYGYKIL